MRITAGAATACAFALTLAACGSGADDASEDRAPATGAEPIEEAYVETPPPVTAAPAANVSAVAEAAQDASESAEDAVEAAEAAGDAAQEAAADAEAAAEAATQAAENAM